LLIETDIDLTMLDLDRAFKPFPPPEITVPLTSGTTTEQITTAGLAVDGRDSTNPNDARFAVWASNNTNVFTIQLVAPTTDLRNDFIPTIKLADVGGIPSTCRSSRPRIPPHPQASPCRSRRSCRR